MPEVIGSSIALREKLADILVKWPLYRLYVYDGGASHDFEWEGGKQKRFAILPSQIKMFCSDKDCGYETLWELSDTKIYFAAGLVRQKAYKCRNCGRNVVNYCFIWQERKADSVFVKVGQYPELEERVPEGLENALGADLKLYKNALRMRNFNLGVAAVAYMRRVVENRMSDMLEILHEAALAHNVSPGLLARHEEMKKEKRFSVKIDYAGELLPATLRPSGKPNPMAILHELASDGLHAKSDEECVDIFDACRRTFEYVFGKLRIETEDAKKFVMEMASLTEKRAKV